MLKSKSTLLFLVMFLALGISVTLMPQAANAQTNKENKQEREDDNKDDDEKLSSRDKKKAKITLEEARAIALKRVAGTVVEEELEKEKGRLQYAFDIRDSAGTIWDVEIDAVTGEVLQAAEDDEDGDNNQGSLSKAKKSVYRTANTLKNVTVRTFDKLF